MLRRLSNFFKLRPMAISKFSQINLCTPRDYLSNTDLLKSDFMQVFDDMVQFNCKDERLLEDREDYLSEMIQYNVPRGKFIRGLTMIRTFLNLCDQEVSVDELYSVLVLGWTLEWLQTCFLVADDIMDQSLTRRNQPCWYLVPGVHLSAINDAFILLSQSYRMADKFLEGFEKKKEILDTLLEITYTTELGQLTDLEFNNNDGPLDISSYSMEKYETIVKHKTAYYTIFLPVYLGILAANVEVDVSQLETLCLEIGEYFQIQDDYLDCFGDYDVTGKVGRDVEEAKCSWVMATALQLATEDEKSILMKDYGKENPECVARIKDCFKKLGIKEKFMEYEKEKSEELEKKISKLEPEGVKTVLGQLLKRLKSRNK